jgi:hypothetical protein
VSFVATFSTPHSIAHHILLGILGIFFTHATVVHNQFNTASSIFLATFNGFRFVLRNCLGFLIDCHLSLTHVSNAIAVQANSWSNCALFSSGRDSLHCFNHGVFAINDHTSHKVDQIDSCRLFGNDSIHTLNAVEATGAAAVAIDHNHDTVQNISSQTVVCFSCGLVIQVASDTHLLARFCVHSLKDVSHHAIVHNTHSHHLVIGLFTNILSFQDTNSLALFNHSDIGLNGFMSILFQFISDCTLLSTNILKAIEADSGSAHLFNISAKAFFSWSFATLIYSCLSNNIGLYHSAPVCGSCFGACTGSTGCCVICGVVTVV